ncbi:RNA ligase family protein [Chryseobacterium sp. DT-3]|uniref:RNA ligase family protein n=1 Tax=Chryseobacterium sp. DT-3 TaxID=3396164 RepID=UPI003F1C0115
MFVKYQHLERFGTSEVENIELGECYVFPKIDGTNSSVWIDKGVIKAGSRNRELSLEKDNAGFYEWVLKQKNIIKFLYENPNLRLFGEWLVPHSLKTYKENAWRKFYVFDVCELKDSSEITHDGESPLKYIHYNSYKSILDKYDIEYIPPIAMIERGTYELFIDQLAKNVFLIEDGKGAGEGIVIKNYDFKNKYNRNIFAKIVTSEFKEKHAKTMGGSKIMGAELLEEKIAEEYVTKSLCEKVLSKIESESGWNSNMIPRLLHTVFYDLVKEDSWEFVKKHKNPNINFGTLQHFTFKKVKNHLPQLF